MYNSAIQYIQSRGRARRMHSRFFNLVETGNMKDLRRLKEAVRDSTALQQFCSALPEERKVLETPIDAPLMAEVERLSQKTFEIKKTGARLSHDNSIEVLARFTSSLARLGDPNLTPEYAVIAMGKKFIADVILPDASPITTMSGYPQRSKQQARSSAAFEACITLIKMKHIDDHLQPAFLDKLPKFRNARLAISSKKQSEYHMKTKPEIWSRIDREEPLKLFPAVLALDTPSALGKLSSPIVLLTRESLPEVPSVPLYLGNGHTSLARIVTCSRPLEFSHDQLESLRAFTLKTFNDLFSKDYNAGITDMPYFLAPSSDSHSNAIRSRLPSVDMNALQVVSENDWMSWEGQSVEFFTDKLVIDPLDGSRKFSIHGINSELKPSDPIPAGAPLPKSTAFLRVEHSIKEYSNSFYFKKRLDSTWREDQPVINAKIMSLRRDFLDQSRVDDERNSECCIILEPLKVSPVSFCKIIPPL